MLPSDLRTLEPVATERLWRRTVLLAAALFVLLMVNNERYIFRTALHEYSDYAAISLQVRDAKRFEELHGHYSRWGFHHPGPALIYVYALGEAIFYDAFHLVPTPFNGQKIALFALTAFFFSAALVTAGSRVAGDAGRRWFLPLALLVAACHFGAVGRSNFLNNVGENGLLSSWPPYVQIAPFLCLLVAAASVGAGSGQFLPLLVLAGYFLVHTYIAQPLFVVPLTCLAYGGLLLTLSRNKTKKSARPWRVFPRPHLFAGLILAAFTLPLAIDLVAGSPSNLSLIFEHVRVHKGEHKEFLRSALYFLHFASYTKYPNLGHPAVFGAYDLSGVALFWRTHWRAYGLWILVIFLPWFLLRGEARPTGDRRRFIIWAYLVLCVAICLSVAWGRFQDGDMFYFTSYFYFAIYYALTLPLVIAIAVRIEAWLGESTARERRTLFVARANRFGPWLLSALAAAAFLINARGFRAGGDDLERQRALASSVESGLSAIASNKSPIFLAFEHDAWESAVGVALQLERRGQPFSVPADWKLIFGPHGAVTHLPAGATDSVWRIVSASAAAMIEEKNVWSVLPLNAHSVLALAPPLLDPSSSRIDFMRKNNFGAYMRYGWSSSEGDWAWSERSVAQLDFRPIAAATDVEISVDASPFLAGPKLPAQRVEIFLNETQLGAWKLEKFDASQMKARIPAALWNAKTEDHLTFVFPDACSPRSLGLSLDSRLLGAEFHRIEFHSVATVMTP